jgi:hypothetical protein
LLDLKAGQRLRLTYQGPRVSAVVVLSTPDPKAARPKEFDLGDLKVGQTGVMPFDVEEVVIRSVLSDSEAVVAPRYIVRKFNKFGQEVSSETVTGRDIVLRTATKDLADGSKLPVEKAGYKVAGTKKVEYALGERTLFVLEPVKPE